ncbi:Cro/C1-type HTH DNA-binding domain protein [Prevotella melaninogenica]|uniref:helix-turn-helix domain-containing protein n=1 Tax=Prevotella melaninogenica TaxID=28132 RepID=UPI0019565D02|nr:helix-turn-helix transcriptional regulator [Prevotella melaninogenica]VTY02496.1 Cro/C1-type HTH DNA-binding domain protein [Prevotella melaninogenica]
MEGINQIKFALVKSKKTNKCLTEQLEVIPTTVSKWCTNTTQPDLYTLKKIAGLLNIPVSELIVSE